MTQTDEFGEELADFARRVAELKSARSVSGGDLPTVLDAALFELDHVVAQLWPQYERLSAVGPPGVLDGGGAGTGLGVAPCGAGAGYAASRMTCSRTRLQQRLIRRDTCICEMPSCSAMRLWVMSPKKRM